MARWGGKLKRLVYTVTVPLSAAVLLRGQLAALGIEGFEITVITSPGLELETIFREDDVRVVTLPMEREINLVKDLRSLFQMYFLLRQIRPTIVNASTPKAGLLGMLAAWLARVPVRVYQQRGLRLETTRGLKRAVLWVMERLTAACAHWIVCNSNSLLHRYRSLRLAPDSKLVVLGSGSSNGVDTLHFQPAKTSREVLNHLRQELHLAPGALVIGFVGRLTRDKGVVDLLWAFDSLRQTIPDVQLMVIGPIETGDPLPTDLLARLRSDSQIISTGFVVDTAPYYQLMDVLAFPSYREGFPNAPLEAAASAVPTVGYRATGTVDAVRDGITGLLVDVGDREALAHALRRTLISPDLRRQLGTAARERTVTEFDRRIVWEHWSQFYQACITRL